MSEESSGRELPYRLREPFLSATERALFLVLKDMMGERYWVCPKVGLNELFYIVRPNENVHFYNKFFRKHADFLLCDVKTLAPAFGVKLVHRNARGEPRESDKFMEEIFLEAGLPLVCVPAAERYDPAHLIALFQMAAAKANGAHPRAAASDSVPNCPVCGKMMVLRIRREGAYGGKKYYGCMDSPRCPGVVPID